MKTTSEHQEKLDSLGRRSRFVAVPSGKRLSLGPRDVEILRCLHRYRFLRQDHLLKLINPKSGKRLVERLGCYFPLRTEPGFSLRSEPPLGYVSWFMLASRHC